MKGLAPHPPRNLIIHARTAAIAGTLFVNVAPRQLLRQPLLSIITRQLQKYHLPPVPSASKLPNKHSWIITRTLYANFIILSLKITLSPLTISARATHLYHILKTFPISFLKIPNPFVDGVVEDENDYAISTAIHGVNIALNLQTIAEAVETQEQLNALREIGCHSGQGYLLGKPSNPEIFVNLFMTEGLAHEP